MDERLGPAFRRVLLGRYDGMVSALASVDADPDRNVHSARKAMKRTRGLLRMVRDEVGREAYRAENVVLRDTARKLSGVRDGFVQVRTLERVRDSYDSLLSDDVFASPQAFLKERSADARRRVLEDRQQMTDIIVTLKTARARIERWDADAGERPNGRGAGGLRNDFTSVAGGLERVYTRGHTAMDIAYSEQSTHAFHDWRKRVKYLRFQIESMRPVWPAYFSAYAKSLDELGELLGDDHDLAVLAELAYEHPEAFDDERERSLLLVLVERLRGELQYAAAPLGRAIYAEEPEQFVSRLGSYWKAAHRG